MLEKLQHLRVETIQIVDMLNETTYEKLEQLSEEREKIFSDLLRQQNEFEDEYKKKLRNEMKEILKHDEKIVNKMNELRLEASEAIKNINRSKQQQQAYTNTNGSIDSIFFDRKE